MSFRMPTAWRRIVGFAGVVLIANSVASAQAVRCVDDSAPAGGDGLSWATPYRDLQSALAEAVGTPAISEIRVGQGVYRPAASGGSRAATFRLVRGVALRGGYSGFGAASPNSRDLSLFVTTLSGDLNGDDGPGFANRADNSYHVVTNNDTNVTNATVLDGFVVRGGQADGVLADKTDQGGGFHNHSGIAPLFNGRPRIIDCTFTDNWAANHGAVNDHGGLTLERCTFRDNFAAMWGGGLYIHEMLPSVVTDCVFENNQTDGTSGGGGGVVHEGLAVFTRCTFVGNTSAAGGGGMYNHSGGVALLNECTFRSNGAFRGGGFFNTGSSHAQLTDCVFESNSATDRGGGVYSLDSNVTLTRCTFTGPEPYGGNQANRGCGLYVERGGVAASTCTFRNGKTPDGGATEGRGGGAYLFNTTGSFDDCLFERNRAFMGFNPAEDPDLAGGGGAVYTDLSTAQFTRCEFNENEAKRYGSGAANVRSVVSFTDCQFYRNRFGYGGGLSSLTVNTLTLRRCTFRENGGSNVSGGLLHNPGQLTAVDCVFEDNTCTVAGGAATITGPATVVNCRFIGNSSGGYAGGVDTGAIYSPVKFMNCEFLGNRANTGGGGLVAFGDNVRLINCTLVDNVASLVNGSYGGGGLQQSFGTVGIDNSIFWNNVDSEGMIQASQIRLQPGAGVIASNNCIRGWTGALGGAGNFSLDPLFTDRDGADGIPNTVDDDLSLAGGSPCVDVGGNAAIPPDAGDLDGDGNVTEPTPLDLAGHIRLAYAIVDLGAYEGLDDCNDNSTYDGLDIATGTSEDCNQNLIPDECDLWTGTSPDLDQNQFPDECDCNGNAAWDADDVAVGTSFDCNANFVPDECDIASGVSLDTDQNQVPDECGECLVNAHCSDGVLCTVDECAPGGTCAYAASGRYGDINLDGFTSLPDVLCLLDTFAGLPGSDACRENGSGPPVSEARKDLAPCPSPSDPGDLGDGFVSLDDVLVVLNLFAGALPDPACAACGGG